VPGVTSEQLSALSVSGLDRLLVAAISGNGTPIGAGRVASLAGPSPKGAELSAAFRLDACAVPDNRWMTKGVDLVYDAAIAAEKLKEGTKYERLTAIVFKILQESAHVVHDVRLRGDGKETAHQIDVDISADGQKERHRILVECKDHGPGTKVDLPEIRNFNGALMPLRPARGIFVTTSGYTAPARSYARDENIALVELRPFAESDWDGRIRQIKITADGYSLGTPETDWIPTGRIGASASGAPAISGRAKLDSTLYYDENGDETGTLAELLDGWWHEILAAIPTDGTTEISGTYTLPQTVWLSADGGLAETGGFTWRVPIERSTHLIKIDLGTRIVDLLLRSVQIPVGAPLADAIAAELARTPERIFTRDQIQLWSVGDDHVLRSASE